MIEADTFMFGGCVHVYALIKLIKAFSGCEITWIGDACIFHI